MLPPRSIAAHAPALDRQVLRAIANPGGPWSRRPQDLAQQVAALLGRPPGRWVGDPESALLAVLGGPVPRLHLAMPTLGRAAYARITRLTDAQIHWMEPARGRLDPGPSEVAEALAAGVHAVLLAPLAGDCSALPEAARLCADRGARLALDARASMAARVLDGGPAVWGDVCLVPVDAEGGPSPCAGAILLGEAPGDPAPAGGLQPALFLRTLAAALRDEPHLRRLLAPTTRQTPPPEAQRPPPAWAVAAASVRATQAQQRNAQRARHARTLGVHCAHLPAVRVPPGLAAHQSTGLAVPLLAQGRDEIVRALRALGLEPVLDLAAWLAPPESRGERAQSVANELLALPLHPFYRPRDIDWLAERLRQATLRVNGDGRDDPTEAVPYAAAAAGEH